TSAMNHAVDAGMEVHITGGMKVIIEAGMQVTLKGAGGFIDIGPTGIAISGTMVMINSGGAAGSGSGCSALSPAAAESAGDPQEPTEAADDESGDVSEPPPEHKEPREQPTFSPASVALLQAAEAGTPFCEQCERARREQEAANNGTTA
ncbi:MAG: hypothetical protein AB7O77_17080, partial [Phycisphaerales bacterium]